MKKIIISSLILMTFLGCTQLTLFKKYYLVRCPEQGPQKQDNFDMYLFKINLSDYYSEITSHNEEFDIRVVEVIKYRNKEYPIYQIDHFNKNARKNLLIFAATHGNEIGGMLAIPHLLENILENPNYYDGWNIRIITPINPVGVEYQSRYNEYGCDINRDFKDFATVGATVQKDAVLEFQPDIIVSFHEGPNDGFFMIGGRQVVKKLEYTILDSLKSNNINLARKSYAGFNLKNQGLLRAGFFIRLGEKLFGIYSLDRYADEKGIPVITTESNWAGKIIKNRIAPHIIVTKAIIGYS